MIPVNDQLIDQYWSLNPRLFPIFDRLELHQKSTGGSPAHVLSFDPDAVKVIVTQPLE